jgi:hypothetical protein
VKLLISKELQDQIYWLCNNIHDDEWSGVLFYKILEGDFGDQNCVVSVEYLYLMDIGSATYTEYDFASPELISFLMKNPDKRKMKYGHIHSHNKMGVFFSPTDMDELKSNAPNHNFYLSLIVNNRNEMTAKVAFAVTTEQEIAVKSIISRRTSTGTLIQESPTASTDKKTLHEIFYYDCDIEKPQIVEDLLMERAVGIAGAKAEARAKQQEANKQRYLGFHGGTHGYNHGGSYSRVGRRSRADKGNWETGMLFDDDTYNWGPDKNVYQDEPVNLDKWGDEATQPRKNERKVGSRVDKRVYEFLVKLLTLDPSEKSQLSEVLKFLDKALQTTKDVENYAMEIEKKAVEYYIDSFPEDQKLVGFDSVMEDCQEILEAGYLEEYPELVAEFSAALNLVIDKGTI